jgi:hypothetical protein
MFDKYNHLLNVIFAILLTVSPHFLQKHGLTAESAHRIMAEAEQHAQKIIETGDASELEGLSAATADLEKYRPALEKLEPLLEKVAGRLNVGVDMNAADTMNAPQKAQ